MSRPVISPNFKTVVDCPREDRHMTEHEHQARLFAWVDTYLLMAQARKDTHLHDKFSQIFAVPNGSHKSKTAAVKFKREGLRAGVPDIFVDVPKVTRDTFGDLDIVLGLRIELKKHDGTPSPEQIERLERYQRLGYKAVLCYGWRAAQSVICEYLGVKP